MPGPNVGSVSVRVTPDLKTFRSQLQAELSKIKDLKIPVTLDLDKGKFDAEMAKIRSEDIKIPAQVDIDQDTLGKTLAKKPIKIPAKVDIDQDELGRALAGRKITIPAEIKVDRDPFKEMLRGITSDIGTLVKRDIGNLGTAFTTAGRLGASAFASVGESLSGVGEVLGQVGPIVGILAKAGVASIAIAEAGAAITAAWGAASTAIAAVPAAIGLIGAPIAAVLLGMDGIKAAGKAIEPQFKSLQKTISAAFQQGLTPVLKNLADVLFPKLGVGLAATATALSGVAKSTVDWLTSTPGIAVLSTTIGNINTAIGQINLVPLVEGFTKLAGNSAALQALTGTINQLGIEMQKIADSPFLNAAFTGLEGVLKSLTTAFGDLVTNGIELFAAAAPGVQAAIDGIGRFFSKFNWTALGTAVGNAFRGIGDAIGSIPQGTVDRIQASFEHLGTTLNSPGFKTGLQGFANQIPGVVSAIDNLAAKGADIGTFAENVRVFMAKADIEVKKFSDSLGTTSGAAAAAQKALDASLGKMPQDVNRHLQSVTTSFQTNFQSLPPIAGQGGAAASNAFVGALAPVIPDSKGILTNLGPTFKEGIVPAEVAIQAAAERVVGHFGTGLANLSPTLQKELGPLGPIADTGLAPLADTSVPTAVQNMANAVNAAIPGLGTAFATGFTALGPLVTTAFQTLSTTAIPLGLTAMGTAITTGFTTLLGPAITTGFTALTPIFATAFTTLGTTAILPGMTALGLAMSTAFTTVLGPAITTGFTALLPIFTTAFTTLGTTAILPGMTALGLSMTTAFTTVIGPAVTAGFTALTPIFTAAFTLLNTTAVIPGMTAVGLAITTAFTTVIGPAVTTGFAGLATVFQAGFVVMAAAATAGMASVAAAVTAGFAAVNAAATAGMVTATAAVTAGFANMVAAADAGGVNMVTSITTTMTNFAKAITDGGKAAVTAIQGVVKAVVAAIDVNALVATGKSLIEGMAKGMIQGIPAVEAAARQAVQKAVAAANAEANVNSPSRLFRDQVGKPLTEGQAVGQLKNIPLVEDAARKAVRAAVSAAQDEIGTVGGLGFDLGNDISSRFDAIVAANGFDSSGSSGDVILHNVFQVGTEAVEEIFKTLNAADKRDLLLKLRAG